MSSLLPLRRASARSVSLVALAALAAAVSVFGGGCSRPLFYDCPAVDTRDRSTADLFASNPDFGDVGVEPAPTTFHVTGVHLYVASTDDRSGGCLTIAFTMRPGEFFSLDLGCPNGPGTVSLEDLGATLCGGAIDEGGACAKVPGTLEITAFDRPVPGTGNGRVEAKLVATATPDGVGPKLRGTAHLSYAEAVVTAQCEAESSWPE